MDIIDGDSFWELCGEFILNHGDDIGVSAILLVKMKRPMQGVRRPTTSTLMGQSMFARI